MTEPAASLDAEAAHGDFMRLFSEQHHRLYAYIYSLLLDRAAADEVFQETSVVLWKAFGTFRREGNFLGWACGVALNQVRRWRRQKGRDRLVFSEGLIEKLAEQKQSDLPAADRRRRALSRCLKKLRDIDRQLIERCYGGGESFREVAEALGKPSNTVYCALSRIRRQLHACIDRAVRAAEAP